MIRELQAWLESRGWRVRYPYATLEPEHMAAVVMAGGGDWEPNGLARKGQYRIRYLVDTRKYGHDMEAYLRAVELLKQEGAALTELAQHVAAAGAGGPECGAVWSIRDEGIEAPEDVGENWLSWSFVIEVTEATGRTR